VSLFNSGLENVFISERNVEHLNTILQTVLHFAKDSSNSTTQKMAFGVFLKMVNSWTSQNVFVPFVYNEIIPATFTVPMDSNFNIINGQNVMVK
jgi:exportin-T